MDFSAPVYPPEKSTVILIHGAIVNQWTMMFLAARLRRAGWKVRLFAYRSMRVGLEENVRRLRAFIAETPGEVLHVVGHSMGGVLMRHVFEQEPAPRPGRLVAIGSPFLDCWVARRGEGLPGGKLWMGQTVWDHLAGARDPVWRGRRDLGVMAGTFPLGLGSLFPGLPKPSDGVVLWKETRLEGMTAHLTFRLNHFGMLGSRRCADQIALFLYRGIFALEPSA
jgi:pimeloyl-ACP methyl ester carboxylesterase